MRIRIGDEKNSDPGSEIDIPDPQHCILHHQFVMLDRVALGAGGGGDPSDPHPQQPQVQGCPPGNQNFFFNLRCWLPGILPTYETHVTHSLCVLFHRNFFTGFRKVLF
jgi:hypothetical protein